MRRIALALCVVLALALAGCAEEPRRPAASGGKQVCGAVEKPAEQSGGHLLGEATPPLPYSSTPPTSGWHASGNPSRGVHAEPLSEPEQVTVLELGGVVITWNGLAEAERAALEDYVAAHAETVASTPYGKLGEGEIALAAWGVLRRCGGVDLEAIAAFVDEHAGGGPTH